MASVTLDDLRKSFQEAEVIHGVSMEIADGEFVALVGPSGCGKSTLLRMIAGLEDISSGTLRIGDTVVNELEAKDRDIAMVFQNYALYPHLTVAENLGFSLKMRDAPKDETETRTREAARILGLEPLLSRKPKQLSGGQRQRVAMGRAIVRDPKVFLFDEPLSNLDAKLRVQMRAEIKTLHRRLGTTMIYVTHDQIEAMTMSDRIVVLRGGVVEQIGAPLDLYERPANTFVAGFIGSPAMNLLTMQASGAGLTVVGGVGGFDVPVPHQGIVQVGIRPDDLTLVPQGGLPGEVVLVEPTGSETVLTVDIGLDHPLTVISRDRRRIAEGERIHIRPDPERLHFFDPDSGLRLETHS